MDLVGRDDRVTATSAAPGFDRRRLLGGAAVGAAAVWVAPSILRVDAAAAATPCIPETISWAPFAADLDLLDPPDNDPATIPYGAAGTATLTFDSATAPAPPTAIAGYALVAPLGNELDNLTLGMTAAAAGDQVSLTIDFDVPLTTLDLALLDIDLGDGNWQDSVLVQAFNGATPITITPAMYAFDPLYISAVPTAPDVTFTGIFDPSGVGTGVPNGVSDATVDLTIVGPITQVVLTYIAGPLTPATPQPQQIGLGPMTVCL